jgi:hypothetical protein
MICFKLNIKNLALNSSQPTTIKKSSKKPKKNFDIKKKRDVYLHAQNKTCFVKKFL